MKTNTAKQELSGYQGFEMEAHLFGEGLNLRFTGKLELYTNPDSGHWYTLSDGENSISFPPDKIKSIDTNRIYLKQ